MDCEIWGRKSLLYECKSTNLSLEVVADIFFKPSHSNSNLKTLVIRQNLSGNIQIT